MLEAGHAENALPQRAIGDRQLPHLPRRHGRGGAQRGWSRRSPTRRSEVEVMGDPQREPGLGAARRRDGGRSPGRSTRVIPASRSRPYLEAGGTDGLVYRAAGIPTWASSGIFMQAETDMFFHGLNERIPVASFYQAIDHIHDLAVELGRAMKPSSSPLDLAAPPPGSPPARHLPQAPAPPTTRSSAAARSTTAAAARLMSATSRSGRPDRLCRPAIPRAGRGASSTLAASRSRRASSTC